ncbi:MAG: sel1 repeat family protein [Magnetococcales bacterium]|nr:sel1 repeat family protein [Magnetococcales bacterium]
MMPLTSTSDTPPPSESKHSSEAGGSRLIRLMLHLALLLPVPLLTWFILAQMQPFSMEAFRLGGKRIIAQQFYTMGEGRKALSIWLPMAKAGDAESQVMAGHILLKGMKVPRLPKQAVELYRRAALQDNMHGQFNYGAQLLKGLHVPRDIKAGLTLIRRAAEKGHISAQQELALLHYLPNDMVPKHDAVAFHWATKLAAKKHRRGTLLLGMLYLEGRGVEINIPKGLSLLNKASEAGSMEATLILAQFHFNGAEGRPPNKKKAFHYFEKAAQKNHLQSLYMTGAMLVSGQGVATNLERGTELLKRAIAGGSKEARKVLDHVMQQQISKQNQSTQ